MTDTQHRIPTTTPAIGATEDPAASQHPAALPRRMRAITQDRYGTPNVLTLQDDVEVPSPGPGEVLLEVHAAGVDRGVWHLVTGWPYPVRVAGFGLRRPKQPIPGMDVAGRVVALGDGVTQFAVGDEVFGIGIGAYAEYARARADKLVAKPAELSFRDAAVVAISGLTAHQALHKVGRVQPGQRVLVLGASGGVGSYAVQLAQAAGAEVTGVASAGKDDLVRSLGAHHVVDYRTTDVTAESQTYHLIIDTGGLNPVRRLRRILTPTGTLVIVGGENGGRWTGGSGRQLRAMALSLMPWVRQRLTTFVSAESGETIEALRTAIEAGDLRPTTGRAYRLEDAPTALQDLTSGVSVGKSVIEVLS
jgi:NADPH:quinone reductase-like Zn-dependent oxidoreductase